MFDAIIFDVDDTIYDQQQPFRNAIKKVFPSVRSQDMHPLYIRFRVHSDENFNKVITSDWTLTYMRNFRICRSLEELNYPTISDDTALAFQEVYEKELDTIVMHQEVRKALDFLQEQEIALGIITNGPTDHQHKKIMQLDLLNWVHPDHVIISQATGYEKPDKEIFKLAEKQFDLVPEKTLYIGDNFDNDVAGSKSAGWKALWFNHRQRKLSKETLPIHDIELTAFEQLLPALKQLVQTEELLCNA
ncbi:HAD family hydrolase [Candidatus Enterococcus ferrettii]|uniref:HAD superfamily hydrolase n=1 Tax=Candidatus Enterococcus ferrettii TaxID=2815324 RepID=A0ABV0ENZ7_9ENTE|nr:HAD family hydrolase [Enterococcus sp. 665A]MBO1340657.1 HAD family hydrolase [Enterococcus sp. 665A]